MELDIVNSNPAGLDVVGTPTLRQTAEGFEALLVVGNRGSETLHSCMAYLLARGEVGELIDFAEVHVEVLGPGERRPLRLKVQEPGCEEAIVVMTLQLAVAGAATVAPFEILHDVQYGERPAEPVAVRPAALQSIPLTRHGTGVLRVEDSARAVREGDDRASILAEVTNNTDQILPAVRLQVLGYDDEGFIVALDEDGPWPLEPGRSRAARVTLGPVDHVIATVGLFAVADTVANS